MPSFIQKEFCNQKCDELYRTYKGHDDKKFRYYMFKTRQFTDNS